MIDLQKYGKAGKAELQFDHVAKAAKIVQDGKEIAFPAASGTVALKNDIYAIPSMTKAQRDALVSPAAGAVIYQTDNGPGIYYFDGTVWNTMGKFGVSDTSADSSRKFLTNGNLFYIFGGSTEPDLDMGLPQEPLIKIDEDALQLSASDTTTGKLNAIRIPVIGNVSLQSGNAIDISTREINIATDNNGTDYPFIAIKDRYTLNIGNYDTRCPATVNIFGEISLNLSKVVNDSLYSYMATGLTSSDNIELYPNAQSPWCVVLQDPLIASYASSRISFPSNPVHGQVFTVFSFLRADSCNWDSGKILNTSKLPATLDRDYKFRFMYVTNKNSEGFATQINKWIVEITEI